MNNKRLLIDMDGTLAVFRHVEKLETLYEKGYFLNLEPIESVIKAVEEVHQQVPDMEIYVMSSVLSDSPFALSEKNMWLNKYLPWIDAEHRIFPPCGQNKIDYVPGGINETDFLLDDYTYNLSNWEPPARGIKLLNGINHTNETWKGAMLRYDKSPRELADNIIDVVVNNKMIQDERPLVQRIAAVNDTYHVADSGYISRHDKNSLQFLSEKQALKALENGLHICVVREYPEFHGLNIEYYVSELKSEADVRTVYSTVGAGIVHAACISPYYDDAAMVKKLVDKRQPTIKELTAIKDLDKSPKL